MRYTSKRRLVERIENEHQALDDLLRGSVPMSRYREKGVWGDGWSVLDLLAHLTEWEQMFLTWYREGLEGGSPVLPAPGFKWNQTPALNRSIRLKHRRKAAGRILAEFKASYAEILSLARRLSSEELLEPGHFVWTGKHPLATYLGPNSCSHYAFAARVLRRWLKRRAAASRS